MKRGLGIALLILIAAWGLLRLMHRPGGSAKVAGTASPLFTGKEPKLKVKLSFPSLDKPGFSAEMAEIFLSASRESQVKQILLRLFEGPQGPGAAPAFPAGFAYREVFVTEKGLAVIDLDPASVAAHPGGTSSEFVSLYCLFKSLTDNFRDIREMQVLIGGESRESLAGHFDISRPLTLEDF